MISLVGRSISLALLLGGPAIAAPNNFTIVVGAALVCEDKVSADYLNDYMRTHFGSPAFQAGGANWWRVNESLFKSSVEYVLVGRGLNFVGATFKESPEELVENVRSATGIEFKPLNRERWSTPAYSMLIRYYDQNTHSKMYCRGYPHAPD